LKSLAWPLEWNEKVSVGTQEVYFDDFKVTHVKSPVIATDDYYVGGSTFNSYTRESSVLNKIKFQETEWQDALGLNLYDFDSRLYDPLTWRTITQDPHADLYPEISSYSFLENSAVNAIDPSGMDSEKLNKDEQLDNNNFNESLGKGSSQSFGGGTAGASPQIAICPTCDPKNPDHKKFIDDPNNIYYYDPASKIVSNIPLGAIEIVGQNNADLLTEWKPNVWQRWGMSNNWLSSMTYSIADGAYVTGQFFTPWKSNTHLDGQRTVGQDRANAFANTAASALPYTKAPGVVKFTAPQFSQLFKGTFINGLKPSWRGFLNRQVNEQIMGKPARAAIKTAAAAGSLTKDD